MLRFAEPTYLYLLAVLPVLFYSGRRGPRARGFYWIYPLHLYAFSLAGILLLR